MRARMLHRFSVFIWFGSLWLFCVVFVCCVVLLLLAQLGTICVVGSNYETYLQWHLDCQDRHDERSNGPKKIHLLLGFLF